MAATSAVTVPQLFTELERAGKDGHFAKAQKIATKSKLVKLSYFSKEISEDEGSRGL